MINRESELALHLALRTTPDGELIFALPNALKAIAIYTERQIAILGIEVLAMLDGGYRTEELSSFSSRYEGGAWGDFVISRNTLAVGFIQKQTRPDSLFLLTTATHFEYAHLRDANVS